MEDRVFYESLYEMHKAGKIDLMARSSVPEDEKERQARESEPDAYALTYEESRTVIWAYNIYDAVTVLNNYIETDPRTGLKVRIINAESTEKIKQTFKEYGLNTTELYNLADRVFSENWFSLFLTAGRTQKNWQKLNVVLYAKIDGKTKRYPVSEKKYPAIYDNRMTKTEIRNAFDLPQNCKFLLSTELDVLEVLKTVCDPNQAEKDISKIREIFPIEVPAVPSRVATPSTKLTEKLFTPDHIEFLPTEQNQYTIEENGQITLFQQSKNKIAELHAQVMSILFAVFINQFKNEEEEEEKEEEEEEGEEENEGQKTEPQTISFYAPDFCKKAGIDPREYSTKRDKTKSIKDLRWQAIYKRLKPLETVMGRSIDGVWYRILTIESYDKDREIIKVRTPYLANIYKFLAVRTLEEKRSQVNMLFSSTVVNEPNGAAFELANYLLNQLLQLGNYSKSGNGVVKYTTRYSTLISNCPQLQRALDKIQTEGNAATRAQAYNAKLKQTFEAAYKIIYTKSDAQDYFIDFQINGVKSWKTTMQNGRKIPPNFRIPTKTQINDKLTISHKGKNPNYHRPEK